MLLAIRTISRNADLICTHVKCCDVIITCMYNYASRNANVSKMTISPFYLG